MNSVWPLIYFKVFNQSINLTSIASISPVKPGSVAPQPNQWSTSIIACYTSMHGWSTASWSIWKFTAWFTIWSLESDGTSYLLPVYVAVNEHNRFDERPRMGPNLRYTRHQTNKKTISVAPYMSPMRHSSFWPWCDLGNGDVACGRQVAFLARKTDLTADMWGSADSQSSLDHLQCVYWLCADMYAVYIGSISSNGAVGILFLDGFTDAECVAGVGSCRTEFNKVGLIASLLSYFGNLFIKIGPLTS